MQDSKHWPYDPPLSDAGHVGGPIPSRFGVAVLPTSLLLVALPLRFDHLKWDPESLRYPTGIVDGCLSRVLPPFWERPSNRAGTGLAGAEELGWRFRKTFQDLDADLHVAARWGGERWLDARTGQPKQRRHTAPVGATSNTPPVGAWDVASGRGMAQNSRPFRCGTNCGPRNTRKERPPTWTQVDSSGPAAELSDPVVSQM